MFETEFKNIAHQEQLRCDPKYRYFYDIRKEKTIDHQNIKYPLIPLKRIIKFNKTKNLKKGLLDDEYILIELEDIEPGTGEIIRERVVTEIGSDKTVFGDSDILISKLMPQMGHMVLNNPSKKYIGTTELLGFKIINKNVYKKYLLYILLAVRHSFEYLTSGKTHPRMQVSDLLRIKIPLPPKIIQEQLVSEIEKIEEKITTEKQKIIPLQDVIDDVFIKYGVKCEKFKKGEFEVFTTNALSIGKQKFLRCGAQYRAFWDVHGGLLFNGKTKYPIVKLGSLMRLHKAKTLKKGILDKEYILIELEDIEQRTGKILNMERIVTEIGSDKTYFGDADLITTKLRPYLGYTILNIPELELIGTTELLPFKVNKDKVYPEYLKYVLLSHEYLEKSQFLMYGKEHPRIHPLDLLNIKIPIPPKDIQKRIISEIQKQEEINDKAKQKLNDYRNQINNLIFEYLTNAGGV